VLSIQSRCARKNNCAKYDTLSKGTIKVVKEKKRRERDVVTASFHCGETLFNKKQLQEKQKELKDVFPVLY
jgi:hypothetical protein